MGHLPLQAARAAAHSPAAHVGSEQALEDSRVQGTDDGWETWRFLRELGSRLAKPKVPPFRFRVAAECHCAFLTTV